MSKCMVSSAGSLLRGPQQSELDLTETERSILVHYVGSRNLINRPITSREAGVGAGARY